MDQQQPIAVINFKSFSEASGVSAIKLAKICDKVSKETGIKVIVAVQAADLREVSRAVSIKVFAQHIDPDLPGEHTGAVIAESVKMHGAAGTLLNHSEKRISAEQAEQSVARAKSLDLATILCADTPWKANLMAKYDPDYIAIEPPELVGGDISVSTAKPEVITATVENIQKQKHIPILCGAGIKTSLDVRKAIELGASGILVAHAVVKARDPELALRELLSGFSQS
jgi:triosephosphate isomerase (TIM)